MPVTATRLAAVALLAAVAGGACGGDDGPGAVARDRAEQARRLAAEAGLDDDVQDLLALAASAVDERYVVTYELDGEGERTITVTSVPPQRRVDVTAVEPGSAEPVTRAVLSRDDGTYSCRRGTRRWFCARAGDEAPELAAFTDTDVTRTIDGLRRSTQDAPLVVEERSVAGVAARCLVSRPRGRARGATAPASLCVSPEGVPLLVERPAGTLRATSYTTEVPDGALDLPAEPT